MKNDSTSEFITIKKKTIPVEFVSAAVTILNAKIFL